MSTIKKPNNDTVMYHTKQIIKIIWENINLFLDWGGCLVQKVIDGYIHNKMVKYRHKSNQYFERLEK